MNWRNLVPKSAVFTQNCMLIPYKGIISTAFVCKLCLNTGYNYVNLNNAVFLNNESSAEDVEKLYDSERSWAGSYFIFIGEFDYGSALPLPNDVDTSAVEDTEPFISQMTTEYQTWLGLHYKYVSASGFRIKNENIFDQYVTGTFLKLHLVSGAEV